LFGHNKNEKNEKITFSYQIQCKSILEWDVQSFEKFQGQIVQSFRNVQTHMKIQNSLYENRKVGL
jgi:hypothetical protein